MTNDTGHSRPAWRQLFGVPLAVTLSFGLLMVVTAIAAGLPIRDPDGFIGPSYVRLPLLIAIVMLADVVPRVFVRSSGFRSWLRMSLAVLRERWTGPRLAVIAAGLSCFYLAYVAYRNLKSFLPFLQERLTDPMLATIDSWVAYGAHPANVLHAILGTGISAHILSLVYMVYMLFVPITLAAALAWSNNLSRGAWYATALSFNWILGTVTYYMLPALGPIYVESLPFADLPRTAVTGLQEALWGNRIEVLAGPHDTMSVHGIAAFASLHVSVVFTAALIAQLTRMPKPVRVIMWIYVALTCLATVYFGWHYVADVPAGFAVGGLSVWLAALAVRRTGIPQEVVSDPAVVVGQEATPTTSPPGERT
ncbi:phosphatase PAP2 family protein [Arthrobacter pigmenti]